MPRLYIPRKIQKTGDSLCVTLPYNLLKTYSLKEGDYLTIIFDPEIDNALDHYLMVIDLKGRKPEEIRKMLDEVFPE